MDIYQRFEELLTDEEKEALDKAWETAREKLPDQSDFIRGKVVFESLLTPEMSKTIKKKLRQARSEQIER